MAKAPDAKPFEQTLPFPKISASWANQYEFRFVEGEMRIGPPQAEPASTYSKIWISDRTPRKLDMLSLMSMSDAFFGRIFHARRELVPFGTVSLTTYFHVSAEDCKIMQKSYADQKGVVWSPNGRLLATTTQIAYFKA